MVAFLLSSPFHRLYNSLTGFGQCNEALLRGHFKASSASV
jgi:hypothetical protein